MSQKPLPASALPALTLPLLDGGSVTLGKVATPGHWQLVVVYRGKHCPICTRYLGELNGHLADLAELGVEVVVVSGDTREKAEAQMEKVAPKFPVAYGLTTDQMAELGLYISHPRSPTETDAPFSEPGLFVVNADGRLQIVDISNAPVARPDWQTLVKGLKFIMNPENNYPIRGTFDDGAEARRASG